MTAFTLVKTLVVIAMTGLLAGDGTQEQFAKMHEVVQRTSPNYYNIANPIELTSDLVLVVE